MYYETMFKCRCLSFLYQRISITYHMNGVWKSCSHMSLVNLTHPLGLHREWYQVLSFNERLDEDNLRLVKYRRRHEFGDRWY